MNNIPFCISICLEYEITLRYIKDHLNLKRVAWDASAETTSEEGDYDNKVICTGR